MIIEHIKELFPVIEDGKSRVCGADMATVHTIKDAWLLIKDGLIADYGPHPLPPPLQGRAGEGSSPPQAGRGRGGAVNASGCLVMPAFCDSHTHLVFAGSREQEYVDKIRGLSYEEIAKRGGGILNSARRLHETSESDLYDAALARVHEIISYGTGAVEIKSGYGLTTEDELKMLRVIRRLKETTPLTIRATFLGAHTVPAEYKGRQTEYVDLIINEMIPQVATEDLADYIDVFCDRGFFTVEDTERILMAGIKYGLKPKIHANELDFSGGIQVGVKYGALSVDHLEYTGNEEIATLLQSDTMPTILPGASFFLCLPYAPARKMIDAGLPVAMASDLNPGSSPSGNMQLILSMGCTKYRMLPEESLHAVTINGAYAMGVDEELGSITRGKKANLLITKPVPSLAYLPYSFGSNKVDKVILNGTLIEPRY
ncbi:MAG: imidazolonepropionase [Bacteroidetes bacterium]|nr:imidazolonepropionase [Bacteroidota bacterium]